MWRNQYQQAGLIFTCVDFLNFAVPLSWTSNPIITKMFTLQCRLQKQGESILSILQFQHLFTCFSQLFRNVGLASEGQLLLKQAGRTETIESKTSKSTTTNVKQSISKIAGIEIGIFSQQPTTVVQLINIKDMNNSIQHMLLTFLL